MKLPTSRVKKALEDVVGLLVRGEWQALADLTDDGVTPDQLRERVLSYPATFVMPPPEAYDDVHVYEFGSGSPQVYAVEMDLWSEEEGRSDLQIQIEITQLELETRVTLTNIRVP